VASRLQQESQGYRQAVIANSEGEASRFSQIMAEYAKAPVVTRQRIYLDTMQQVMSNTSKVIVDQKGGNSLLYLPLDKLQQMVSQPPVPTPEPLLPATPTTPSSGGAESSSSRSRDAFRNRDREDRP